MRTKTDRIPVLEVCKLFESNRITVDLIRSVFESERFEPNKFEILIHLPILYALFARLSFSFLYLWPILYQCLPIFMCAYIVKKMLFIFKNTIHFV